ncbi:hypothetical protein [Lactobacillus delbrueckii]|uniref:hypothetical protein n=1 Tax=Lactobacillus delbrueckii TaxID=1584 RepID=UPI001E4D6C1F|nr:hypothetical protein [Lactobacillus delbrueckii]MCD5440504.1 hypothetical protein [Lactobacillus delbrueckii subsp. lactis]
MTAFTGVDSQNLPDVMVSVQFILAIGGGNINILKRKEKFLCQGKGIPGNFFEKNRAKPLLFKA